MIRAACSVVLVGVVVLCATPVSAVPIAVLDEAELGAGLLVPTAVPGGGWSDADPGVVESRPRVLANDVEDGWCGGATDAYGAGELQVAATAESTLAKSVAPDEPVWFLWTKAYSFPDVARAQSFLASVVAAEEACDSWVLDGEPVNGVSADVVTAPAIGNDTLAYRTTIVGDGVSATEDYVYVRLRNNVVVTHTRIVPADDALVLSIARAAKKSLKKAVRAAG